MRRSRPPEAPSRRTFLSLSLILGGIVLLAAIAVGNDMGDRVIGQLTQSRPLVSKPLATPVAQATDADELEHNWKKVQVVTVATDPAFPDPRVTPTPPPPPPPTPKPKPTPKPTPSPTEEPIPTEPPPTEPPDMTTSPGGPESAPPPPPTAPPTPGGSTRLPSYAVPNTRPTIGTP